MSRARRRRQGGLTLLEVLGAVMLLGILYSVLAAKTSQGVWNEANARSRLEASLRADQVLAEIETALAQGVAPERGAQEVFEEDFRIVTEVTDFALEGDPTGALEEAEDFDAAPVFGSPDGRQPSVAVQIRVRVSWDDGAQERHVERITFGFDRAAADAVAGAVETGADAS